MKKNLKNRLFKISTLSLVTTGVVSAVSASLINNNSVDSFSYQTSLNSQANVSRTGVTEKKLIDNPNTSMKMTNIVPLNDIITNTSNIPQQNTVYDYDYNAYATITSSQKYSSNAGSSASQTTLTLDQITKFNLVNTFNTGNGGLASAAGSIDWVVKTSDLVNAAKNNGGGTSPSASPSALTIKSLLYSPGGNGAGKSLFVLTKGDDSKFYLFRIQWENQTLTGKPEMKGGSYELVKVLDTPSTGTNTQDYNFMVLESSSTHTMQIMNVPDINSNNTGGSTSTSNVSMSFVSLSQTDFSTPQTSPTSTKTITIESTVLNGQKFASNQMYKPIITVRDGATVYLTYQAENYKTETKDKFLSIIKIDGVNTGSQTITVSNTNDATTFKLNDTNNPQFLNDKQLSGINIIQNSSTSYELFYTFKMNGGTISPNPSKIGSLSLNLSNAFNLTERNIDLFDYLYSNSKLYSIQKLYKANEDAIDGYVLLDEQNRVVQLDANKSNPKLLYDFETSTIKLGKIYNLVTRRTNQSWFAQMEDGTFAQFLGSTLIGQWDKLSSSVNRELPASVSIKSNSEVSQSVLYQEVFNSDGAYTSSFETYLKSSTAYRDFLNINFIDPRITTNPDIVIEYPTADTLNSQKNQRIYTIELTFKQKLRNVNIDGSINSTDTKEIVIGKQQYTFNNAETSVAFAEKQEDGQDGILNFEVPTYIRNKKPSQVTADEVKKYLIQTTNITNPLVSFTPHDQNGSMDISVTIPIAWTKEGETYTKRENWTFSGTLGSELVPFFRVDKYGDQGSVKVVDTNYDKNSTKYENLSVKYSDKVASSVSKKEILEDFIIYGSAFNNEQNEDLIKAAENNVQLTPNDADGTILVDLTVPQIGTQENVRFVFTTPSFFLKDASANRPIFFSFKPNEQALNTTLNSDTTSRDTTTIRGQKPSMIASILNGDNAESKIDLLSYFADFSSFFNDYIRQNFQVVKANGNDTLGTLDISVDVSGANISGFNNKTIQITYSGFSGSNLVGQTVDTFSFGNTINGASNMFATDVTQNQLETLGVLNYGSNSATKDKATVTLTPSRSSGTLEVNVSFKNYIETNSGTNTIYPTKTFTRIYGGFKTSKNPVNIVGFKSFNEISTSDGSNSVFSNANVPSRAKELLTARFMLNTNDPQKKSALLYFANVTKSLDIANSDISSVTLIADDVAGTLNVAFTINDNGVTKTISPPTPYSGFRNTSTAETTITFMQDSSAEAAVIKNKLPSEVTVNDVASLYNISNNNNNNPVEITLGPDDATGTLLVSITIQDPFSGKTTSSNITYTGMRVFVPTNEGTRWDIVVLSVVIPTVVLLIPILTLGYIQNIKDRRKIAKKLDRRLDEEFKKRKYNLK